MCREIAPHCGNTGKSREEANCMRKILGLEDTGFSHPFSVTHHRIITSEGCLTRVICTFSIFCTIGIFVYTQQEAINKGVVPFHRKWAWGILLCLLFTSCSMSAPSAGIERQPSRTTLAAQPFHGTTQTFDHAFTITLNVTPNHVGVNVFMASVLDNQTAQPTSAVKATLYLTMQDMAMGTDSLVLHFVANGQFSATGNNLSMGGQWAIGIVLQTPDHILHKAGISLVTSF